MYGNNSFWTAANLEKVGVRMLMKDKSNNHHICNGMNIIMK